MVSLPVFVALIVPLFTVSVPLPRSSTAGFSLSCTISPPPTLSSMVSALFPFTLNTA